MSEFNIEQVLSDIESEVKVNDQGQATISGRGMARLLGVSSSLFSRLVFPKKLAEKLTAEGFDPDDFFKKNNDVETQTEFPDLTLPLVAEYYAYEANKKSPQARAVLLAGGAAFYRQLFQKMKGWESEQPKPVSKLEGYKQAMMAMQELVTLMEYATNKPGLKNIIDSAIETDGKALPGLITVAEVMTQKGREYSHKDKSAIGMYVSTAYRNLTGKAPIMKTVHHPAKNGKKCQSIPTPHYPLDFLPIIENAIELGFGS